jgi:hypothetical protein
LKFLIWVSGTLEWSRQQLFHYIASMRSKLSPPEVSRLSSTPFLPTAEIRENGMVGPSLVSYPPTSLHLPDQSLKDLGVAMVYIVLEENIPFDAENVTPSKGLNAK